jgi:hypothetical protein
MLRSTPLLLLMFALVRPVHADETQDEPMPKPSTPPAAVSAPAPTPAPVVVAAPAAPIATAQPTSSPKVGADGLIEEVIPNPPRVYGYAFGGAALGTLAIGAIMGGVAWSKSNAQEGDASNPQLYTKDFQDDAATGKNLASASYAFLAVGAALAVTDIVLWFEIFRKPRVLRRTPEGIVVPGPGAK